MNLEKARPIRVLLVEDSPSDAMLVQSELGGVADYSFDVTWVERTEEAEEKLRGQRFDIGLLDLNLPDSSGVDTFTRIQVAAPGLPIVVLTGSIDEAAGVEAIRQGVQDYLVKGAADGKAVSRSIRYAIERKQAEEAARRFTVELQQRAVELKAANETLASSRKAAFNLLEDAVAARKETERATRTLRESEERLKTLYATMSEGLANHEIIYEGGKVVDYLITDVNPAYEKITGLVTGHVSGRKASEVYGTGSPPYLDIYAKVASGGPPEYFETYFPPMKKHFAISVFSPGKGKFATMFTDITERKQAEEKLIRARDEWVETFNTMPDLIAILDEDHKIVRVNKAMTDRLGISPEGAVGLPCYECVHNSHHPISSCPHALLLKDGKEHVAEIHEERIGGDFLVSVTPIFDGEGKIKGAVHVARDITEQKRAEEALRRLNRTLMALGRSSQAMLHAKNETEYLKEVCRIVVEECGHAMVWVGFAEFGEGKSVKPEAWSGFEEGYLDTLNITWADTERGRGPTGTAIRTGKPCICNDMLTDPAFAPWRDAAIQRGYASSIVLPLMADNKAFGAINIYSKEPDPFSKTEVELLSELANDLSHGIMALRLRASLDKAAETLRSERNFSNAVIQTTGGLIVGFDPDGRIQIFNLACEKTTGYAFDEVRGRPFWDFLLVPEEKQPVMEVFNKVLEGSVTAEMEFENFWVAKDGERRYIKWVNSALREENGAVKLILGSGIDITERRMMEDLLRIKAEELTDANQELEAFAYSVSHDLRNPLHAIIGMIDIFKDYAPSLDKDFGVAVGHIERSSRRMSDIISNLLMLSRLSRQEMHRESVDVGALAQSCFNELKREMPKRNVRFKGLSGLALEADPGLVQLLIENLIRNAWKFTSKKQEAFIEFGVQQKNGGRVYFVRDNGAGFDMVHAKKIFDPFVRLHTEQEFKGTGIGLAIVKRIVEKHGGTVWAEGEKDKGAVFYFSLE